MAEQQQSNLENICSYNFTGANLLQLSLVKQLTADEKTYKRQHFFFIALIPGENSGTGRTFNFSNKITMKLDLHKAGALAAAVRVASTGQDTTLGKFTQFVDSSKSQFGSGGTKSFAVQSGTDKNGKNVTIFFKAGQGTPHAFTMSSYDAIAFAKICDTMFEMSLKLEFDKTVSPAVGTYSNPNFNTPPTANIPDTFNNDPFINQGMSSPNQVANNFASNFGDDSVPF